jgi:hypothetical protein
MTRRALFRVCLAAACLGVSGCLGGIGDSCKLDSECRTGLICFIPSVYYVTGEDLVGTCRRPCHTDDDCGYGSVCVEGGACFQPGELEDASTDAVEDVSVDDPPPEVPDADAADPPADDGAPEPDVPEDCPEREVEHSGDQCLLPSTFGRVFKMTLYRVGEDGKPGSGLDMDGSSATCAPGREASPPLCSGGIDNAMAMLGVMGNISLEAAIADGSMNSIVSLLLYNEEGCPMILDFLRGELSAGDPACTNQPGCEYTVSPESFDADTCIPASSIGSLFASGERLTGGGDAYAYVFDAYVVGMHIVIPVLRPRVEATLTLSGDGPAAVEGLIGGVITKDDYIGAFEAVPAEDYPSSITKEELLATWELLYETGQIERDFDLDGDTVNEASSVGIGFAAVPVTVTGLTP